MAVESQGTGALGGITLAARTDAEGLPSATLSLRKPGLRVRTFEVHRVAAEDSCGGSHGSSLAIAQPDTGGRALPRGTGVVDKGSTDFTAGSRCCWCACAPRNDAPGTDVFGAVRAC